MAGFGRGVLFLLLALLHAESFSHPLEDRGSEEGLGEVTRRSFRGFIPKTVGMRFPRADGEQQSGGSGVGEFINTAIKDGIASTSAVDSPTMFIGGFSFMMQPMPNGTEFAGQLMQMAPHYMNLIPGVGGK